jgi:outer membrane protein
LAITKDTLDFTMTEENLASSNFNDANFIQNLLEKNPAYQTFGRNQSSAKNC